jgi:peptidoglycan/LPS O-acetylase OafA/YrhL
VNLFFVLSGFLITGILLDAKNSPRYFRNFYARRTLRIFPLYYGVLFVCFAILPLFPGSNSADFLALRSRQGWLWAYCTNIKIVLDGDWKFATPLLDLGHFWSLAVEEHFYLVWPLLVFLLPTRALVKACVGVILIAGLARTWWVIAHAGPGDTKLLPAFVLTPFRMDDLAMGALLAALVRSPMARVKLSRYAIPALGVAFVLLAVNLALPSLLHRQTLLQTSGYSAISLFFACLLSATVFAASGSLLSRFFSTPILRWFGKYAYGLYVFNSIVLQFFTTLGVAEWIQERGCPSYALAALLSSVLGFGVTVLLAVASWNLYEKHFLKLKRFFEYRESRPATQSVTLSPQATA